MTTEETIQRGRRAKELLDNPVYQEVTSTIREATIEQWRDTSSGSTALREQLFFEVHGLDAVQAQLKQWVAEAEFEAVRLEKQTQAATRRAAA